MTYLHELIDIPTHVDKGQFVLRLSEGVTDPQATVESYVVTDNLQKKFGDALGLIGSAVTESTSKASYLRGSFGSGKSHFMAILHLILNDDPVAKAIPELTEQIQEVNQWAQGKKFLLVPYHMIGAKDVESGILGGYVDYMQRHHPDQPLPGVYKAERLFEDAENLRQKMGDDAFFKELNDSNPAGGDWGDLNIAWDAERFAKAQNAEPGSEERGQLIGALTREYFKAYSTQVSDSAEAFINLDDGLSVISKHAKACGYDGLILFLDELILWLASHTHDLKFINDQLPKLTKLVEAQNPDRPIPLVSFIARQRDLAELIGDSVPGVEKVSFNDQLNYHKGRFTDIELADRNLPAIAEKRVLRCKSDAARRELDASFEQTVDSKLLKLLMPKDYDKEQFRQVYPFSPALVQTLIAVSSMLQRERTALKVMLQLLVNHRETLEVGDLIPVGDLFDVIAEGDEALTPDLAVHYENARKLYRTKCEPLLEAEHGSREELEKREWNDPQRSRFRDDDRLIKTLLLSALVPSVEALQGLTAERLAALNHGSIKTPIPGQEAGEALSRARRWASQVGEIRIGEGNNPTISVQLSGVDVDAILEQAEMHDSPGNRHRCIRDILENKLEIQGANTFQQHCNLLWKNTRRACEVVLRNIRELPDASLDNDPDADWKLIIDTPFDDASHGPRDDLAKIEQYMAQHPEGAKTLCWMPQFFSQQTLEDLGTLVKLDHILKGERLSEYSTHLSKQDRLGAKGLLENRQSVLRQQMDQHVLAAYGLARANPGAMAEASALEPNEQFQSLVPGFGPQPPVAPNLRDALEKLIGQALSHDYPAAPQFEEEAKHSNLQKVLEVIGEGARGDQDRIEVEKPLRPMVRGIAQPLKLGVMGHDATHFVVDRHWRNHFNQKASQQGDEITVGDLREWIDQPQAMGLPREAQNLVILVYVDQENFALLRHGSNYDATIKNLSDDCTLQRQELPDASVWQTAKDRAASILGLSLSSRPSARNMQVLTEGAKKVVKDRVENLQHYFNILRGKSEELKIATDSDRLKTTEATLALASALQDNSGLDLVTALAEADIVASPAAMGECLKKADQLREKIENFNWELIDTIKGLDGDGKKKAKELIDTLKQAFAADQHVTDLIALLKVAEAQAMRIIQEALKPGPIIDPPPPPPNDPEWKEVDRQSHADLAPNDAASEIETLKERETAGERVRVNMSWVVEKKKEPEQKATP